MLLACIAVNINNVVLDNLEMEGDPELQIMDSTLIVQLMDDENWVRCDISTRIIPHSHP